MPTLHSADRVDLATALAARPGVTFGPVEVTLDGYPANTSRSPAGHPGRQLLRPDPVGGRGPTGPVTRRLAVHRARPHLDPRRRRHSCRRRRVLAGRDDRRGRSRGPPNRGVARPGAGNRPETPASTARGLAPWRRSSPCLADAPIPMERAGPSEHRPWPRKRLWTPISDSSTAWRRRGPREPRRGRGDRLHAVAHRICATSSSPRTPTQQALLAIWRTSHSCATRHASMPGRIGSSCAPATPRAAVPALGPPTCACFRPMDPVQATAPAPSPTATTWSVASTRLLRSTTARWSCLDHYLDMPLDQVAEALTIPAERLDQDFITRCVGCGGTRCRCADPGSGGGAMSTDRRRPASFGRGWRTASPSSGHDPGRGCSTNCPRPRSATSPGGRRGGSRT